MVASGLAAPDPGDHAEVTEAPIGRAGDDAVDALGGQVGHHLAGVAQVHGYGLVLIGRGTCRRDGPAHSAVPPPHRVPGAARTVRAPVVGMAVRDEVDD